MTVITPNANFYVLAGNSEPAQPGASYREYRRCWQELPRAFMLRDFPMHLDLEASSRCNLRCTFCDKLPLLGPGRLGDMDYSLFCRIVDEGAANGLWGIKLSYRGEPLLHPRLPAMIAYAKQRGILDIYFNTNGMLLDEQMSARLIDAGLDRIAVSVEGTDRMAFERARVGARWDTIVHNLRILRELRAQRGVTHPRVRVQTIYTTAADAQVYAACWRDYADEVTAIDYKHAIRRVCGLQHDWACPQLWQRMTIEWDGTVFACNNNDIRVGSPGNARDKSVRACWHDDGVQEIRAAHRAGASHTVPACDGCPWRTAQLAKLMPIAVESAPDGGCN